MKSLGVAGAVIGLGIPLVASSEYKFHYPPRIPDGSLWTPLEVTEISKEKYDIKLHRTTYPVVGMVVIDYGYNFKKPVVMYVQAVITSGDFTKVSLYHVKTMKRRRPAIGPFRAFANAMPEK